MPEYDSEHEVAEGTMVVVRGAFTGTHKDERVIPATGSAISVSQMTVSRVGDGMFVEERAETDLPLHSAAAWRCPSNGRGTTSVW